MPMQQPAPPVIDRASRAFVARLERMNRFGVRPAPTPAGVPVNITSPGSRGNTAERRAISIGIEKINSEVRAFCICSPSISRRSSRSSGLSNSSTVTGAGPIGVKPG